VGRLIKRNGDGLWISLGISSAGRPVDSPTHKLFTLYWWLCTPQVERAKLGNHVTIYTTL